MVEVGLLEARYVQAVRRVEELLSRLNEVRPLTGTELAAYKARFVQGWEVPGLCGESDYRLRLLLPKDFPFSPPRVAVVPAPPVLTWPHLEAEGFLCLLPESASYSLEDIESVVLALLEDAQSLVTACVAGEGFEQFEDEFQNYWTHWTRTEAGMSALCRPEGPSRGVSAWHGKLGTVIAEDETALRHWLQNRYGGETGERVSPQAIPLIWLPRPLRPSEYPANVGALFSLLRDAPHERAILEQLLLDESAAHKTVLLGFAGRRGAGFAGLRVREPTRHARSGKALTNGFRGRPPAKILLMRYHAAPLVGARITRYDVAWVHGRDHNPQVASLQGKSVILLGAGSVGSSVAELLAKSGIGNITLVDPEWLESENISRHALGAASVGEKKATAQARELAKRFPHLTIDGIAQTWEAFAKTMPERLQAADLFISVIGSWGAESHLNALAQSLKPSPPILYGWTEPHAAAGHAVVLFAGTACLRCLTDGTGKPRLAVTAWPEEGTMRPVPACGGLFQPYGAIELTHMHALIADLALDVLLGQVTESTHRVWIGSRKLLDRGGGKWDLAWVERYGDPAAGGIMTEIAVIEDPACLECGGAG